MPAPTPKDILANPPPLTPRALRNFPFSVRPFPFADLRQAGVLNRRPVRQASAVERVEN